MSRNGSGSDIAGSGAPSPLPAGGSQEATLDPEAATAVSAENKGAFGSFVKQLFSFSGDLSQLTCPAFLLNGLSLLDYSTHWGDYPVLFSRIPQDGKTPEERLRLVTQWFISTLYGSYHARCKNGQEKKPFNPILGEQMFTSWEDGTTMAIEQVCHHPPITAFYLENKSSGICLNGHCGQKTKFKTSVASISVQQTGLATVELPGLRESYTITYPELFVRGLLSGSIFLELCGLVQIKASTGLVADVEFVPKPWIGGEYHTIKGRMYASSAPKQYLGGLTGKWTELVSFTAPDLKTVTGVCFDIAGNPPATRQFKPVEQQSELESHRVWAKVTDALGAGDSARATREKQHIEDEQRKVRKDREAAGGSWAPKLFTQQGEAQWRYNKTLE